VSKPKEKVAVASDVLNRPDPNEKAIEQAQQQSHHQPPPRPVVHNSNSRFVEHTRYDYEQAAQAQPHPAFEYTQSRPPPVQRISAQSNPFSDRTSIQTASTNSPGSNAIPIALVPRTPGGSPLELAASAEPVRPVRSPELDLNLEHLNVSKETMSHQYTASDRSVGRHSYMSGLTTATDIMNEAPVIVQSQRQVLGVSKAEVLRAPMTPATPMTADSTRAQASSLMSRPSIRSPLAATSFGPGDVVRETDESRGDPFGDEHSPYLHAYESRERPTSMATVATGAGTIIADISSAKRVNIGIARSSSIKSSSVNTARALNRMTSGKLVSPSHSGLSPEPMPGTLQQQQERAIAIAHAKAREQGGPDLSRRISDSSVMTNSTRADSILESFPFVPPSPISNRPIRTPPRSPLAQDFVGTPTVEPSSPAPRPQGSVTANRAMLGMSTASEMSTASSGLGSFTFQIASDAPPSPMPPTAFKQSQGQSNSQRQRASLDTLALTSALSSYPLGFDNADAHYPPSANK
jgi:hypothetical protein